jgi:RimJ/RimL family protein N-acetyltransferase
MSALTYRPAGIEDAELGADLMTASYPPMPQDPVITRMRWESPRHGFAYGRFIAGMDGKPIALLSWVHGPWEQVEDGHCEVEVWLDRSELDRGLLIEMFTWIGDRAEAEGSRLLLAYCGEDEPEMLEALAAVGYLPARTEKVWELDLKTHGSRLTAEAAEAWDRMAAAGIRATTLAGWSDPDRVRKLHELDDRTIHDVPHTVAIVHEAFEDFERRMLRPDRPSDRVWIALDGDRPVAMSHLKYPPVRGDVWTGYTCTDPEYRGRGLATGIKLQTLAQAIELGVPFVCTDNDSENAPMLHINEKLGYRRRPGFVEHHKRVTKQDDA